MLKLLSAKSFAGLHAVLSVGLIWLMLVSGPLAVRAQSGGSFVMVKSVIANGGGDSAGGSFALTGTVGQSLADMGMSSGGAFSLASGFWPGNGTTSLGGLEADVAPRPVGNGALSSTDITQMRRFAAGLDSAAVGSEFQRADCAPLASFGNGLISATDITQTRRYVAALDAPNTGDGPSAPGNAPEPEKTSAPLARTISIPNLSANMGSQVVVPVILDSQGNEVALSFSVTYNPAVLSINNTATRIALGSGVPAGTTLTRNISQEASGRLGVVLDADPGTPFVIGQRQLVTITFDVIGTMSVTPVGFGDTPVVRDISDALANSLPAAYLPGQVAIGRAVSIASQFATPGSQVVVPVILDSQGNEVAISFSVTYNPAVLSINNIATRIALGNGVPAGTTLTRNISQEAAGRLGVVLDADPGTPFTAGPRQLVTITFDVTSSLTVTPIGFGDTPVVRDISDALANSLPATYAPGNITITAPTLARVESYAAYHYPDGNLIQWQSSFEAANLGFEVFRQQGDERILITPSLIAGSALFAGAETALTAGNSYSWQDFEGPAGSVYWVRDIDLNGSKTWHGPILAKDEGERQKVEAAQPNSPLLNKLGNGAGADSRWLNSYPADSALSTQPSALPEGSDEWRQQQRIAAGLAVKISVRESGWQRITGAQLLAAGLPALAEHRLLQLYANGRELPLLVDAANPTITADSFVEFYGQGLDTRETDTNVYWLVVGERPGLRVGPPVRVAPRGGQEQSAAAVGSQPEPPDSALSTQHSALSFPFTVERQERMLYFAALDNGEERENFFGAVINQDGVTRNLPAAHLDRNANAPAQAQITLQGVTDGPHSVRVSLNGQELGRVNFNGTENKTAQFSVGAGVLREGDNALTLQSLNGAADVSLVDTLKLTYPRLYEVDNNRLRLTTGTRQRLAIGGFTAPRARLFDVTDPARVFQIAARTEPTASGYALIANGPLRERTLLAVADDAVLPPAAVNANEPTNWTNIQRGVDFLILAHRSLRSEAQPLATLRNAQGLNTEVITIEDIYDEFSGGVKDASAITAFLRWTQTHWTRAPRYLLLVGDASYDPRNYLGLGDFDLTPTRYVATPYLETASDEVITDFDGDGLGEMAVGRLPVRTLAETKAAFDKLLYFYQPANQSGALLVADRPEGFNFTGLNEELRTLLPDNTPVTVVNRAAGTDAQARQAILNALRAGPSIVNYAGHGSVQTWTGAGLLRQEDAAQLGNGNRLPFFVMMTCLNGYFQDLNSESLAEALVKTPHGGAIAAWGSSALTLPPQQALMNRELLRQLYRPGAPPRLGDAVRQSKLSVTDSTIRRTWVLFGDPTLTLR